MATGQTWSEGFDSLYEYDHGFAAERLAVGPKGQSWSTKIRVPFEAVEAYFQPTTGWKRGDGWEGEFGKRLMGLILDGPGVPGQVVLRASA